MNLVESRDAPDAEDQTSAVLALTAPEQEFADIVRPPTEDSDAVDIAVPESSVLSDDASLLPLEMVEAKALTRTKA